jgi:phage gp29-like protein
MVPFPPDEFLVAARKAKSGPAAGGALLRPLAFWWIAANFCGEWFLNFAQIFGQPIRWATYDPSQPGILDLVSEMLENMGSSAWAALPAGTQLELKEAVKGGKDNPQVTLLQIADKVCNILILRESLTTDAGDRGTQALGTVHSGIRDEVIQGAAKWAAGVLNSQFVPAFLRLNFGDTAEAPWFAPETEEVKDAKAMAERDEILLRSGMRMGVQWFHERHDVPVPAPDEEVIEGASAPPPTGVGPQGAGALPQGDQQSQMNAKDAAGGPAQADATDKLTDRIIEDLSGVEAKWLGGIKPHFQALVAAAQSDQLSDEQFTRVLEIAAKQFPELFGKLDVATLAASMEASMGAACVNGAVSGYLRRRKRKP